MGLFSACSRCVFRSFKRFEKAADKLTGTLCTFPCSPWRRSGILSSSSPLSRPGRVGPFFVGLAIILIGGCAITFFDVVYPYTFLQSETSWPYFVFGSAWSVYLVWMFSFHCEPTCSLLRRGRV